jgi:hypothetical protein
MTSPKYLLSFFFLASLTACEPSITFTEPQPAATDNLSEIPRRVQGRYLSLKDSSILLVSPSLISRIYDFNYKVHISKAESGMQKSGDTLIDPKTNEKQLIVDGGDSLLRNAHYVDTLFMLGSGEHVLKKFKGYYFLNKRHAAESWEVRKMEQTRGKLIISSLSEEKDLASLKEITESREDTAAPYHFTATQQQFKEFVKSNGFHDNETFVRQR